MVERCTSADGEVRVGRPGGGPAYDASPRTDRWDGDPVVLLSFLLVLAAAVTLVIGLVGTGLGLIYVSIACSVGAGIVLAAAVLRSRPQHELAGSGTGVLPENHPPPHITRAPS